jgi:hypothetical protein
MHPYISRAQAQAHIDDLVRFAEARRVRADGAPRREGLLRRLRPARRLDTYRLGHAGVVRADCR